MTAATTTTTANSATAAAATSATAAGKIITSSAAAIIRLLMWWWWRTRGLSWDGVTASWDKTPITDSLLKSLTAKCTGYTGQEL